MQRFNSKCLNALSKRLYARWKRNCLKLRKIAMESRIHQRIKWKQSDRMKVFVGKKTETCSDKSKDELTFSHTIFVNQINFHIIEFPTVLATYAGATCELQLKKNGWRKIKQTHFFFSIMTQVVRRLTPQMLLFFLYARLVYLCLVVIRVPFVFALVLIILTGKSVSKR